MDKNSVEYKELMRKMDELTKDVFALADNDADVVVIGNDLFSIRKMRGDEAKRNCEEAAKKAEMAKATEECKEKLIDLISTYIVEVNPTYGGRARRTLIENYANLTIKMMQDPNSALYVVNKRSPQASEEKPVGHVEAMIGMLTPTNSTSLEDAAKTCVTASKDQEKPITIKTTLGDIVDEELLRRWVRRL